MVIHPEGSEPRLRTRTRAVDPLTSLVPLLDRRAPLLFMRRGDGIAGLGEALRLEFTGANRITDAAAAWRRIADAATVDDDVRVPGTGLVAFGAFTFAAESEYASVLIVPRTLVGVREGVSWITHVSVDGDTDAPLEPHPTPLGERFQVAFGSGGIDPVQYRAIVTDAIARLDDGELRKVVVARDVWGRMPADADVRRLLADLAAAYPDTWTFAVDGHVGSSPETLVRVTEGDVSARVLAGSIARGTDSESDAAAVTALTTSAKDLAEHRYAVQSVVGALAPHARGELDTDAEPFALELPNLWHLATNVSGSLDDGASSLDLAAALHPTAAVAGTPTAAALDALREIEPLDRGRYSGPVGWVDAHGDGAWALSLRSAELDDEGGIRAFAGAGILAESDPDTELAETELKLRPIVDALD